LLKFFNVAGKESAWRLAIDKDKSELADFITKHEYRGVPFSSKIAGKNGSIDSKLLARNSVYIKTDSDGITGAILISPDGIICPILTDTSRLSIDKRIFNASAVSGKRFLTVMGCAEDADAVELLLPERKKTSVNYHLMGAQPAAVSKAVKAYQKQKMSPVIDDLSVNLAIAADLRRLMPLRRDYEIEEVVLDPLHFNEISCRNRFRKTITENAVFYADLNGMPVATCCINASGLGWAQIGGVFTLPELRSHGISAGIMEHIAEYAALNEKNLALFVKKDNKAAIRLYENCGFEVTGEYRICYLERR